MVKQLPSEVWEEIASNLPREYQWNFRHLNSAFHHVALKSQYHRIQTWIEYLEPSQNLNWHHFLGFANKDTGKYVHELLIQYQGGFRSTRIGQTPEKKPKVSKLDHIQSKFPSLFQKPEVEPQFLSEVRSLIEGLVNISKLGLHASERTLPPHAIPLFNFTLWTWSSRLTSLVLMIRPAFCPEILKCDLFLPHLTTFCIRLDWVYYPQTPSETPRTIVPFLNRHRLTLSKLNLEHVTDTDGLSVLMGLAHFPALRSISMALEDSNEHLGHFRTFMKIHSAHLEALDIDLQTADPELATNIGAILNDEIPPFRRLEHFILHLGCLSRTLDRHDIGRTVNFIQRYKSSLVTLALSSIHLTEDNFFGLFDSPGSYLNLCYLNIHPVVFTPSMLDVLVSSTPNLQNLQISIERAMCHLDAPDEADDEVQFCNEMVKRRYSEWPVKTIWFISGDLASTGVAVAMTSGAVESFNHKPMWEFILKGPLASSFAVLVQRSS